MEMSMMMLGSVQGEDLLLEGVEAYYSYWGNLLRRGVDFDPWCCVVRSLRRRLICSNGVRR